MRSSQLGEEPERVQAREAGFGGKENNMCKDPEVERGLLNLRLESECFVWEMVSRWEGRQGSVLHQHP